MQQTSVANRSSAFDAAVFARAASFRRADADDLDRVEACELGFDFAWRGLAPPPDCGAAFKEGWLEGRAKFGRRTVPGTPWDRKLVRLRYSAWRRNRVVDVHVTAAYLEHISVSVCPITREVLTTGTHGLSDATVDRVFNDGAYAVGNLAVMSQRANLAKANRSVEEIAAIARRLAPGERFEGLCGVEWSRLTSLCSQALPREAKQHYWPLLVFPPNGLMVSNMLGMLMVSSSLLAMKFFAPAVETEARQLCGTPRAKKVFDSFVATLRARMAFINKGQRRDAASVFHPLEDAWLSPLVWQRFMKFFRAMTPERLVAYELAMKRAGGRTNKPMRPEWLSGWALDSRGYRRVRRDDVDATVDDASRPAALAFSGDRARDAGSLVQ